MWSRFPANLDGPSKTKERRFPIEEAFAFPGLQGF